MENTALKNIGRLTAFDIKNNKKAIIGWSVAIFLIMTMYMSLFESVQEMAQMKLEAMPKEFLSFVGMESFADMSNYTVYFGIIYNVLMIAVSIFAATFAAGTIYREEQRKTIEFLNALNVSRTEIYISKLLCSFLAVSLVLFLGGTAALVCGKAVGGETFNFAKILKTICISGLTAYVFMAFSVFAGGASSKVSAPAVGAGAVLVCYVIGYLGKLLEDKGEWLRYFSPFEMFSPDNARALDDKTLIAIGIYFAVSVVFIVSGAAIYRKRDLHI